MAGRAKAVPARFSPPPLKRTVIRYGIDIGKVVQPILSGRHAHVHDIKTKRW